MTEFIPQEDWKAKHNIGHEAFFLDVYRLVSHFLASRPIASVDENSARRALDRFVIGNEKPEISRLLVNVAAYYRVKYDDGSWEHAAWLHDDAGLIGAVINVASHPACEQPLTFREACNKIIHAKKVHFDTSVDENTGAAYLNPIVYLYGEKGSQNWKATLDVIQFCKAAGNVIV
jgi:hypothetical protein